jgi:hypothetical protein
MVETLKNRFKGPEDFYLPVAVIYFFLNCLFLPEGLQYTTLLTPFFLWWTVKNNLAKPYFIFVAITSIYAIIHFKLGVQPYYYLRSWFLAFCSFIFAITVHNYLKKDSSPEGLLTKIGMYNLVIIPLALAALLVHPLNEYFWYYKPISPGIQSFPRLKMFTYEASYYSLLFMPVFLFFILKVMFGKPVNPWLAFAIVVIPLALSLSFGVILVMAITLILLLALHAKLILNSKKKRQWFVFVLGLSALVAILMLFVFPNNPISQRCFNVFNNKDTSIRGRTTDAFFLACMMIKEKSNLFGIGFGQIKVAGHDLIINYYKYNLDTQPHTIVRIPNTLAETLAMFGMVGLSLQIVLQVAFFFTTKTYCNVYRLAVFIFIFIYQFTGSFFLNIAELTLWVIAFTPSFPQFNLSSLKQKVES